MTVNVLEFLGIQYSGGGNGGSGGGGGGGSGAYTAVVEMCDATEIDIVAGGRGGSVDGGERGLRGRTASLSKESAELMVGEPADDNAAERARPVPRTRSLPGSSYNHPNGASAGTNGTGMQRGMQRQGGHRDQAFHQDHIDEPSPRVCMNICPEGNSCSDLGRVRVVSDPPGRFKTLDEQYLTPIFTLDEGDRDGDAGRHRPH